MKKLFTALAFLSLLALTPMAVADDGSSNSYTVSNDHGTISTADDTVDTVIDGGHRVNKKKCWKATGNWVGGASFINCEFKSGSRRVQSSVPAYGNKN